MKRLAILVSLLAAACGGGKAAEPTTGPTTTTATAAASAPVVLALGELKLVDVNQNDAVSIHADGTIEIGGQPAAKVTADGKIVNATTGEVGFELLPDGAIKGPDGKVIDVTLTAEGAIKSGDKTITVNDDGSLAGANPDAPQMRVEGATSPELKRTALFVLIALTTPAEAPPPPPDVNRGATPN